jgi:hypothetical protein
MAHLGHKRPLLRDLACVDDNVVCSPMQCARECGQLDKNGKITDRPTVVFECFVSCDGNRAVRDFV